jgi:hypothetical protein
MSKRNIRVVETDILVLGRRRGLRRPPCRRLGQEDKNSVSDQRSSARAGVPHGPGGSMVLNGRFYQNFFWDTSKAAVHQQQELA